MKMIFPALLCLLLTTLVGVSSQQTSCTREGFQAIAVERVFISVGSEATDLSDILINETYYNCLSTSETIGDYTTMSVSLLFSISSAPDTLREIRYVMACIGGNWGPQAENNTALRRNDTRTDCYECTDEANNEDYCSPCDSSCTGLNQCYGPNATQCCSYNDGGNCVADCGMNRQGNSTFQCVCSNFWTGANCDSCSLNCQNGGTPGSDCSVCQCIPGYEGMTCNVDIDECDPNPCQNGGACTDGIDSYNCTCVAGYNGTNCDNNIDECSPNPCQNGGGCNDGINSYNCTCVAGFNGTNCDNNIDDCSPNPCQNRGICNDGIDSYNCTCVAGYDGTNCENNIDECTPNPCQSGEICIDGINAYNCSCVAGFTGTNCETNIDECSPNPCQADEICTDGIDSYTCSCAPGFTDADCKTNIDECSPNPCQNGGRCTDLINDYNCTCNPVYSGRNCSGCATPNCEQCKESSQDVKGECTKCADMFVLNNGTCNDNCGISKCIQCDKINTKCILCEEGYAEDNGRCFGEKPDEEGQNSDGLGVGAIIGIIVASVVAALLLFILILLATTAKFNQKNQTTRSKLSKSLNKGVFKHGNVQNPVYTHSDINETTLGAVEENIEPVKDDGDEFAVTGGGNDETELLKEDIKFNGSLREEKESIKEEKGSMKEEKESTKEEKELL